MRSIQWTFTLVFAAFALLFAACEKDGARTELLEISEIENSTAKINIDPSELPANAQAYIDEYFFETYIETAARVVGKGYEVMLSNQDYLYFRENGTEIRDHRTSDRPLRPGPCGLGHPIRPDDLPDVIVDFITNNYPESDILRAKRLRDFYLVLISDRIVLVFSYDGDFVREARLFWHCTQHDEIFNIDDLPEAITLYIAEHCPEGEIVRAALIRGHIIVGVLANGERKIFVFTRDGAFLFMRG